MTTPRLVIGLGLAAIISTGAAVAAWQANHVTFSTADAGQPLVAGLIDKVGDVASISISERNLQTELVKENGVWKLAGSGYPADPDKLQRVLVGLVRLQLLEPKTQAQAKYPLIDVNVPQGPDDKGQHVILKDASGNTLADVVLGKTAVGKLGSGKDAQYVRRVADAQSWLAEGRVDAGARLSIWANTTPVDLPRQEILEASVAYPNQEILLIRQAGKDQQGQPLYELANEPPEGRKVKEEFAIRFSAGDLAQVTFEDVRKAIDGGTEVNRSQLVLEDGLTLAYTLVEDAERDWLSLEVLDKGKDESRADDIIARTRGWQFGLSDTKSEQFRLNMEDLLEPAGS